MIDVVDKTDTGKVKVVRRGLSDNCSYVPVSKVSENARLRELVSDLLHDAMENVCSKSYWCHEKNWQTCNDDSCGSHLYVEMARELGIELDG